MLLRPTRCGRSIPVSSIRNSLDSHDGRKLSVESVTLFPMDVTTAFVALALIVISGLIGMWLARSRRSHDAAAERARHEAELAALRGDAAQARAELAHHRQDQTRALLDKTAVERHLAEAKREVAEARQQAAAAEATCAQAVSRLAAAEAERDAARERAVQAVSDREAMLNQFKVLSNETLDRHGKAADASAEARLRATEQLMKPVAEALTQMQARIAEVEKSRETISAELREQVRAVTQTSESLRRETHSLSTALRTPQVRGMWGEQSLRRIVEMSGLVERCDFFEQTSTRTDDGLFRPDLTIRLAGDKVVFVDSKVPLTALLDAYNTEDETLKADHLSRFGKRVRGHVDDLSKKNYWALDAGSPEFVVLFLPSEEIFRVALEQQPDLQEYANSRQIVLASPSIVIGLLKTVAHGWQQARLAESAAEVQQLGRQLYERLAKLGEHFEGIGRGLTNAVKAYNSAVGSLESRVFVTARRLRDLEVTTAPLRRLTGVDSAARQITAAELLTDANEGLLSEEHPDLLPTSPTALGHELPSVLSPHDTTRSSSEDSS